jgi:hypothetical protein
MIFEKAGRRERKKIVDHDAIWSARAHPILSNRKSWSKGIEESLEPQYQREEAAEPEHELLLGEFL